MKPMKLVPLFNETKPKTSFLPFVLVSVGAIPPGHNIDAPHVTALGVPSAVNINTNEPALFAAGGDEIVNVVIAALRATLNTLPFAKFKVKTPGDGAIEMPGVEKRSS